MSAAPSPAAHVPAHAVIAVKNLDAAKTRLAAALAPDDRARLVLAMLRDTLAAVAASPAVRTVTVVTPDERVGAVALPAGARVLTEPPGPYDLNAALRHGATGVREVFGPAAVLALQADLPALRADELDALLAVAPAGRAFVPDHYGTGTAALLCQDPLAPLDPRFGRGSARAHRVSGAACLDGQWPGLRLDVDTAADLDAVVRLGTGPHTRAVLEAIGWHHSASITGTSQ